MTRLSMIVAVAENNVIGKDGGIPWRIPADMRYFKKVTMGKPVIMGRKTWQSLGKPLPGRLNIIISRTMSSPSADIPVVTDLAAALVRAQQEDTDETMIIGGEALYREALPMADRIYLTRVFGTPEGDTFFPEIDQGGWLEISSQDAPDDESASHSCRFIVLDRRR